MGAIWFERVMGTGEYVPMDQHTTQVLDDMIAVENERARSEQERAEVFSWFAGNRTPGERYAERKAQVAGEWAEMGKEVVERFVGGTRSLQEVLGKEVLIGLLLAAAVFSLE